MSAYLVGRGYKVNETALAIIKACDDWWSNRAVDGFHSRENLNGIKTTLSRMNFAKRCCADDANLCEIISIAPETETLQPVVDEITRKNRFDVRYREQLEKTSATGTVGAYIYLKNADYFQQADGSTTIKGGQIKINYVDADCTIPLTVENHEVIECAFASTTTVKTKEKTTLVIFTINEGGNYQAETVYFNDKGQELKGEGQTITLGPVKPFSIMHNAEVNNLDNMEGYGLPKIYNNIPYFKAIDLCFALLYGDLNKGDKLVFLNELLACIATDENGMATLTPKQKEIFVLLGKELPTEKSIVQEYNPEIRVETITKAFELILSLISMGFGYGTRKYKFENGEIQTATEYIGERQDEMQELNKQRKQATDYITDIIHAALWFSNAFQGTNYNTEEPLKIEFDDSYIEDKQSKLESMRADALSFPGIPELTVQYLILKYNFPEEEARKLVGATAEDDEEED